MKFEYYQDFDKYLAIANHDIQMAKNMGELKSYVASLLYDNDKKVDMIHELEEENNKLKELCDKYEEEHNTTFIEWQKDIKVNKKAIEYIESYMPNYDFDKTNLIKLLEILDKGSDKE